MSASLWGDPPAPAIPPAPPEDFARRGDPDTSKTAAEMGDSFGPLTARVLATVIECERTDSWRTGVTPFEVRERMAYGSEMVPETGSVCRRFTTLARAGYVRDTGVRRRSGAGREQIAWASTEEGRQWAAS